MKEFNLEAAKNGAPVQTKNGLPVRIICFDAKMQYPVIALVTYEEGHEEIEMYKSNGRYLLDGGEHCKDLVMASTKKSGYIAIYCYDGEIYLREEIYPSKEAAEKAFGGNKHEIVDIQHIEWEE